MIVFDKDGWRFNYRVAGIILDGERVLLERVLRNGQCNLPGGRVEWGEAASEAIVREAREELGVVARIERLVWAGDNLFCLDGQRFHELNFYFLLSCPGVAELGKREKPFPNLDAPTEAVFEWYAFDRLESIPLYPTFLRQGLRSLPVNTVHFSHRDAPLEEPPPAPSLPGGGENRT